MKQPPTAFFCDCGNRAFKRYCGAYICVRCADIERRFAVHAPRNGGVVAKPRPNRNIALAMEPYHVCL